MRSDFTFITKDTRLSRACMDANDLVRNADFWNKINFTAPDKFDNANIRTVTITMILNDFVKAGNEVEVKTFCPWWPWSKAVARFKPENPFTIELNKRRIGDPDTDKGKIIHEWVHLVDNLCDDYSFGHGGNSSRGKERTAPYFIGRAAKWFN